MNYNRYTYALNNPLKYTDPLGYYWEPTIGSIRPGFGGGGYEYNYSGGLYPSFGATGMTSNPFMPSYSKGPFHYNWGSKQYEDNNGDFVTNTQAMAWASQYSTKQYKFIKIGSTSHTTLNSASFAPNEGEYGVTNPNGWQNHHTADFLIQGGMLSLATFFPGVGWVVAGGYFVGDLVFQHYHDGQSITEYYFDKQ